MKKIMSSLVLAAMIIALLPIVTAERVNVDIGQKFQVFRQVNSYQSNEVSVLTVEGGVRGYVVITAKTEAEYERGIAIAKRLLTTQPDPYNVRHGTSFAFVRARI